MSFCGRGSFHPLGKRGRGNAGRRGSASSPVSGEGAAAVPTSVAAAAKAE